VVKVWAVLFVTVISLVVAVDLHRADKVFADRANMRYQRANDLVCINETVLEGFAVTVSTSDSENRARILFYAKKMLKQYPHRFSWPTVTCFRTA
jgi:hypothetical protein